MVYSNKQGLHFCSTGSQQTSSEYNDPICRCLLSTAGCPCNLDKMHIKSECHLLFAGHTKRFATTQHIMRHGA